MEKPLYEWRTRKGLTIAEASARIEVTEGMWSRWENNKRQIPAERVIAISNLTGIPRDQLRSDLAKIFIPENAQASA